MASPPKRLKNDPDENETAVVNETAVENEKAVGNEPERIQVLGVSVIPEPIQQFDIIRRIFRFLNARELSRAACVCKSWNHAADVAFTNRMAPEFNYVKYTGDETESSVYHKIHEQSDYLMMKPCCGIIFTRHFILPMAAHEVFTKGCAFQRFPISLEPHLVILSWAIKIYKLGKFTDCSVLAFFLPKIPDLKITKNEMLRDSCAINEEDLFNKHKQFFDSISLDDENKSSCVILLLDFYGRPDLEKLEKRVLEYFRQKYRPGKVALWGAKTSIVGTYNSEHFKPKVPFNKHGNVMRFMNIHLSSPSLQSWSIEICKDSKVSAKKILEHFRSNIKLKKHSLALVLHLFFEDCSKWTIFKEFFPDVPLISCCVRQVCGINTLDKGTFNNINLFCAEKVVEWYGIVEKCILFCLAFGY